MTGRHHKGPLQNPKRKLGVYPSEMLTRLNTFVDDQRLAGERLTANEVLRTALDKYLRRQGYWPADGG